jgi:hypothetical protein
VTAPAVTDRRIGRTSTLAPITLPPTAATTPAAADHEHDWARPPCSTRSLPSARAAATGHSRVSCPTAQLTRLSYAWGEPCAGCPSSDRRLSNWRFSRGFRLVAGLRHVRGERVVRTTKRPPAANFLDEGSADAPADPHRAIAVIEVVTVDELRVPPVGLLAYGVVPSLALGGSVSLAQSSGGSRWSHPTGGPPVVTRTRTPMPQRWRDDWVSTPGRRPSCIGARLTGD